MIPVKSVNGKTRQSMADFYERVIVARCATGGTKLSGPLVAPLLKKIGKCQVGKLCGQTPVLLRCALDENFAKIQSENYFLWIARTTTGHLYWVSIGIC